MVGADYVDYQQQVPMILPWRGFSYRPGSWSLRRAWENRGFGLLISIPPVLLAIEAVEELKQGRFAFHSLVQIWSLLSAR